MSSENMDVVRGLFEAFVTDGLDPAGERFLDRDAEYVEDPIWPARRAIGAR